MLIRRAVQSDSIVALSPCGKEFCNTFPPSADICTALAHVRAKSGRHLRIVRQAAKNAR